MTKQLRGRVNDPVFQHTNDKGVYVAKLMGYNVRVQKFANAYWEVHIVGEEEGFLASGSSRVDAMKEAYYTIMYRESQRLDWILANQPYRKYPDTHPRRKAELKVVEPTAQQESKVIESTGVLNKADVRVKDGQIINKADGAIITGNRIKALKDKYFIKFNRNWGGHFWFEKTKEREVVNVGGPFQTENAAFKDVLEREEIIR